VGYLGNSSALPLCSWCCYCLDMMLCYTYCNISLSLSLSRVPICRDIIYALGATEDLSLISPLDDPVIQTLVNYAHERGSIGVPALDDGDQVLQSNYSYLRQVCAADEANRQAVLALPVR